MGDHELKGWAIDTEYLHWNNIYPAFLFPKTANHVRQRSAYEHIFTYEHGKLMGSEEVNIEMYNEWTKNPSIWTSFKELREHNIWIFRGAIDLSQATNLLYIVNLLSHHCNMKEKSSDVFLDYTN